MGPRTDSSCCCQAQCVMGPSTASHCCCLHRHTLPCATFRSPHHCWWVPFCHRVLADYGPPHCCCQAQ
ncbi:unnamed protein product [Staurois parvus]|uniref:Uncharacterized protein n=1 Tax=Staurois parvus TaxID=386267 RepID=A0ABN9EKZ0_9NEOB|nr:unnamed protein product [Staurois parvus]